jgi:trimeric autotransporter adhesin
VADRRQNLREIAPVDNDLRSRVSSLAQAIGSFDGVQTPENELQGGVFAASGSTPLGQSAAAFAVANMADVMRQFDAHGNMIAAVGATAASPERSLQVSGIQEQTSTGYLASPSG